MEITQLELQIILDTLGESLKLADNNYLFNYRKEARKDVYEKILTQLNKQKLEITFKNGNN